MPTLQSLDGKLSEQIKQQLALQDFLIFACDNSSVSVYYNGANEIFQYKLDLGEAPTRLIASETELIMFNQNEMLTLDMQPLRMLLKPMQAMFTDLPKLALWLEFVDRRLDRCK